MSKKATKACNNDYYIARYEASKNNPSFESREKAAEYIGIDRTRLARIELNQVVPYPEEVLLLSQAYNMPELCNSHCTNECPVGKKTLQKVEMDDFDRIALKVLGSLKDIDTLRMDLINIAEDGIIDHQEQDEFNSILEMLQKISTNAQALHLWALKHIKEF